MHRARIARRLGLTGRLCRYALSPGLRSTTHKPFAGHIDQDERADKPVGESKDKRDKEERTKKRVGAASGTGAGMS